MTGWITTLTACNSGILTSGKGQSFYQYQPHLQTRYLQKVSETVKIVHAYDHYVDKATTNYDVNLITLPYDVLLKQLCAVQPHADYWFKSMELALLILQSVYLLLIFYGDT